MRVKPQNKLQYKKPLTKVGGFFYQYLHPAIMRRRIYGRMRRSMRSDVVMKRGARKPHAIPSRMKTTRETVNMVLFAFSPESFVI